MMKFTWSGVVDSEASKAAIVVVPGLAFNFSPKKWNDHMQNLMINAQSIRISHRKSFERKRFGCWMNLNPQLPELAQWNHRNRGLTIPMLSQRQQKYDKNWTNGWTHTRALCNCSFKFSASSRWNCECFVPSRHSYHLHYRAHHPDRLKRSTYDELEVQCIFYSCCSLPHWETLVNVLRCWHQTMLQSMTTEGVKVNLSSSLLLLTSRACNVEVVMKRHTCCGCLTATTEYWL